MIEPLTMTSLGDGIYSDDGDGEFEENNDTETLPLEEVSPPEGDLDSEEEVM